jgi:hypothetical protein
MSTTADVGRTAYNETLSRGRSANLIAREALRRIIDETPGPQTTAMLIARAAVYLGKIDEALTELEQLGRRAKNLPDK